MQVGAAAAVLAGFLYHYYVLGLAVREVQGRLAKAYTDIVAGTAHAPDQYRILNSRLVVWLQHTTGAPYRFVAVVVDGLALLLGALLVLALLKRLNLHWAVLPAALYIALLGEGTFTYWHTETIVAFLGASGLALAFVQREARGGRALLLASSLLLVGTRTDVLATFALAFGARWWWKRRHADLVSAAVTLGIAIGGTVLLVAIYSDAEYLPGVSVVQLAHNLNPSNLYLPILFLLPVALPLLRLPRPLRDSIGTDVASLLVAVACFTVATLVVGRVEEVRLWFPLAGVLSAIGAAGWQAYYRSEAIPPSAAIVLE